MYAPPHQSSCGFAGRPTHETVFPSRPWLAASGEWIVGSPRFSQVVAAPQDETSSSSPRGLDSRQLSGLGRSQPNGLALLNGGRPQEAVAELREALKLRPNFPEAEEELGTALAQTDI